MMGYIVIFSTYIVPTFLSYKRPHRFCAQVASRITPQDDLIFFRDRERYISNELNRTIRTIETPKKLRTYLEGKEKVYCLLDLEDWERLKRAGFEGEILIYQKPFLKRRRSIALIRLRGSPSR